MCQCICWNVSVSIPRLWKTTLYLKENSGQPEPMDDDVALHPDRTNDDVTDPVIPEIYEDDPDFVDDPNNVEYKHIYDLHLRVD